jgi:hypothetical protein
MVKRAQRFFEFVICGTQNEVTGLTSSIPEGRKKIVLYMYVLLFIFKMIRTSTYTFK